MTLKLSGHYFAGLAMVLQRLCHAVPRPNLRPSRSTPYQSVLVAEIGDITDPELPSSALLSTLSPVYLTGSGDVGTRLLSASHLLKLKLLF